MKYRIKDSVNLKELEKFGYFQDRNWQYYKDDRLMGERVSIWVEEDRAFFIEWGWYVMCGEEQERFIKDLIKADLVEKVDD